jgi:parallel beta-helix repeat protein
VSAMGVGGQVSGPKAIGTVVNNNTIVAAEAAGIIIQEGTDGFIVANNTIRRSKKIGILAAGSASNSIINCAIEGNVLTGCGLTAGGAGDRYAISVQNYTQRIRIGNNHIVGDSDASYSTRIGIYVGFPIGDISVVGNTISGTATYDLGFEGAPGTFMVGNDCASGKFLNSGGTNTFRTAGFAVSNTQPAPNADTSGASLATLETEVNQLKAALRMLGWIAT